jgi:hypothetical protein
VEDQPEFEKKHPTREALFGINIEATDTPFPVVDLPGGKAGVVDAAMLERLFGITLTVDDNNKVDPNRKSKSP